MISISNIEYIEDIGKTHYFYEFTYGGYRMRSDGYLKGELTEQEIIDTIQYRYDRWVSRYSN